jgi:putative holliday junction resolvase
VRVLALDYGLARIGCAISDPTETLVRPLDVIEPPEPGDVAALADREEAGAIVVGLPLGLSGEEGEQARATLEFCERLRTATPLPVDTYDERLTTRMAASSRRAGARAAEDSLAAAHLLEAFLASRRKRNEDDA